MILNCKKLTLFCHSREGGNLLRKIINLLDCPVKPDNDNFGLKIFVI